MPHYGAPLLIICSVRLIELKLQKYGRFSETTILYTDGKMTAIVGANESGKTTLLTALLDLNAGTEWTKKYIVNAAPGEEDFIISGKFSIEKSEILELSDYEQKPKYLTLKKYYAGNFEWSFDENPILALGADVILADKVDKFVKLLSTETKNDILDAESLTSFLAYLRGDGKPGSAASLEKHFENVLHENFDPSFQEQFDEMSSIIESEIEIRKTQESLRIAIGTRLTSLRPKFLLYSESVRNLPWRASIENLEEISRLRPILQVGGITPEQISELLEIDLSKLNNRLRGVSKKINETIMSKWRQANLEVELRAEEAGFLTFEIYDVDAEVSHPIERRSEGLRQFIALSSFLRSQVLDSKPIILIDEIEQHLHLQAQAELVDFFERQNFASQVIFSTHSPGALPQDLNNVRAVVPANSGSSTVKNRPWQERGNQVENLFNLLGAGAYVFGALRAALVTEGNVDAMLYPTIFREASSLSYDQPLGFQCIPGPSSDNRHTTYSNQSVKLAYQIDGDEGGIALKSSLEEQGVDGRQIFILQDGLSIEDYIKDEVLIKAINEVLSSQGSKVIITSDDLVGFPSKMTSISQFFKKNSLGEVDKKRVAAKILDYERLGDKILDPKGIDFLSGLFKSILKTLK